jgi:hypothetical protein
MCKSALVLFQISTLLKTFMDVGEGVYDGPWRYAVHGKEDNVNAMDKKDWAAKRSKLQNTTAPIESVGFPGTSMEIKRS